MDLREAPDEWLMRKAACGHALALEILMRRYHRPLHAFILHQGAADPEDLYQETWIKAARAAPSFDTRKKFSTWLFAIALNVCRDAHRAGRARPQTVGLEEVADLPAAEATDADSQLALRECLAALPPQDRELLALRYYRGMKESEVAEILSIPVGTVKSRSHQAVQRLKDILKQRGMDNDF